MDEGLGGPVPGLGRVWDMVQGGSGGWAGAG